MPVVFFCAHGNTNLTYLRKVGGLFSKQNDRANEMPGGEMWIILEFQLELILIDLYR